MSKDFAFFRTETSTVSEKELEHFESAANAAQEIVGVIYGWCGKANRTLHDYQPAFVAVIDFTTPDWIDSRVPEHAVHELHRIALQIRPANPPATIVEQMTPDEKAAIDVLRQIRNLHEVIITTKASATDAILIIRASLLAGISTTQAHVAPWEPFAAVQYKAQTGLINASRGTPQGSANALRAEESQRQHQKLMTAAIAHWEKNPRQSASAIAERLKREMDLPQTVGTLRKVISKARPR